MSGAGVFFRAELLRAEENSFEFNSTATFLTPAGPSVPGTVGTLAGVDLFAPGTSRSNQVSANPAAGLIEQHLRAERDVQARELAFQELDAIQLSTEFEFEQTDRLLTAPPLEERRSSGLLLATSPHAAYMGAGPEARAVPTSRDAHWIPAGHSRATGERRERSATLRVARPVPLHSHTNYFSIRNGYIRKGVAQNVQPAFDFTPLSFSISTFSISHDSILNHGSRIHQTSKPTVNFPRALKFACGWFGAASGQKNDQVSA